MTEYDNDPQRQTAVPGEGSAYSAGESRAGAEQPAASAGHPTTAPRDAAQPATEPAAAPAAPYGAADASAMTGSPDATAQLGTSGPTAPGTPAPGADVTAQLPFGGAAQPSQGPVPPRADLPPWAVPAGTAGAPQYSTAPQGPMAGQPTGPYPGAPISGPAGGQPSAPPYPGAPQPGPYSGSPQPGMPQPGMPQPGMPQPGMPQPGMPQQGEGFTPPPWAQTVPNGPQRPPSRLGRFAATGVAAVVLAVGSGLVGGFIATQLDDDPVTTVSSGNRSNSTAAAPVIQRDSLATIADKVQPSVVSISTSSSEGSGVVLSEDGYLLTNNHVIASAQGGQVNVVFSDGKTAEGKVMGTDPRTDLAVVKAAGVSGLKPATFGDSDSMRVGDTVLALGSPLGLQGSVTAGIVSALDRTIQVGGESQQQSPLSPPSATQSMAGLLQTDAPINPGNSGGALVNLNGEVIGINTAIATSGQGQGNIGVGFAIPSNKAKQVAEQLKAGEDVKHPFLGVSVTDAEGGKGALVGTVQAGSPAAKIPLQKGDVITKLGDREINGSEDLVSAVQSGKVGDRMELIYIRNGEQKSATVKLDEAS